MLAFYKSVFIYTFFAVGKKGKKEDKKNLILRLSTVLFVFFPLSNKIVELTVYFYTHHQRFLYHIPLFL